MTLPETNSKFAHENRPDSDPKRKRSYSNQQFSGAFAVSFWEGSAFDIDWNQWLGASNPYLGNLDGNSLKPPKKPEVFGEDSLELPSNRGGLLIDSLFVLSFDDMFYPPWI